MPTPGKTTLEPRKRPRQGRSRVTVEAIHEATVQVLLAQGLQRLTTTRVAERAGVSIGTLYQYFPHKQALLFAVLERHLARVGAGVRQAATAHRHAPLSTMIAAVVAAFVAAKTADIEEARAMYVVASELDARDLVLAAERQGRAVLADMLATATDARFDDLDTVVFMVTAAMIGPTRTMLEGDAPSAMRKVLRAHLETLCLAYLERNMQPLPLTPAPRDQSSD